MPLQTQTASINFGQGIDTKTDPKLVIAGKLISLRDGVFTNGKRVTKRNGYDAMTANIVGGGSISSPTMCKSYRDELVIAASSSSGPRLFSYSQSLNAWADRGKYASIAVKKQVIDAPVLSYFNNSAIMQQMGTVNPNAATNGSQTLFSFDAGTINKTTIASGACSSTTGQTSVYITVTDNQTGAHLADRQQITSSLGYIYGYSRAALLGSSTLAVFYIGANDTVPTTPKLCLRIITISQGGGVSVGSEVVLGACTATSYIYCYDVETTSAGAVIAAGNGTSINLYTINTSGTTTHTATISSSGSLVPVSISLDSTGTNAWIYWMSGTGTLKYAVYSASTLSSVLGATTAQTGLSNIQHIVGVPVSASSQTILLSSLTDPATGLVIGVYYPVITQQTVTSGGSAGAVTSFLQGIDLYSKSFSVSGRTYVAGVTFSQTLSTGFLIDFSDQVAVAKFLPEEAEGVYSSQGDTTGGAGHVAPNPVSIRNPGFLVKPLSISSTIIGLSSGFVVTYETIAVSSSGAANNAVYPASYTINAQMGVSLTTFDFSHIDSYQAIIQQDTLVMNGGMLFQYDGAYISELGFNAEPDGVSALATSGTGGHMAAGVYTYYVTDEWTDANGNLHQSAPSQPIQVVFTTGTTNKVVLGFNTLTLTQKQNATKKVWRTVASGTQPYLIYIISNTSSGWSQPIISQFVTDGYVDTDITSNPQLYTQQGSVLENIAPPPAIVMWTKNNRLWVVDSENPETNIEYCKTASSGSGISFSTGQLELVIDSSGGEIVGGSSMDEKTIIIKESAIGFFIGDGANDAGFGSSIQNFQFIPSDTGGTNGKSVSLFSGGLIFRSPKGIYLVNRGLQVGYFGADVEAYSAQDIRAIEVLNGSTQLRILTSSGYSLLYDSYFNQWGTFSNHAGLSSTLWNDVYVYVRTDGSIYKENTSTFLDSASSYAVSATLSWIKAISAQNFERVKMVALLGDATGASGHGVQMSFAYDYGTTFVSSNAFSFTSASNSAFEYDAFLPQQKCSAVQIQIQEITTGASGEYIDFSDLSVDIGVKKGLNKLPASQRVG